ncbi:hypothetical protein H6G93_17945 [Nostoc sp. FACHB-973]|nr:hypothetical protein [Nostoc sp. FACHB-973]
MLKQIKDTGTEKTTPDNTDIIPLQQADGITRHITRANFLTGVSVAQQYPEAFTHFHDESIVISGNSLSGSVSSNYWYTLFSQSPAAINNSFKFRKQLKAGNYTLKILGITSSNYGILSLAINGVSQFSDVNLYSSSTVYNVIFTKTITIASDGYHEFIFTVAAKSASSSGYVAPISKFWAYKT